MPRGNQPHRFARAGGQVVAAALRAQNAQPTEPEWPCCPRCGEHAVFEVDAVEGLVSTCCTARPMSVDVEPREDWNA